MNEQVRNGDCHGAMTDAEFRIVWHESSETEDSPADGGRQGAASGGTDDSGFDQRLKVWHSPANCLTNRIVIVARTKNEAIALSGLSRQAFEQDFELATGSWWHRFARNGAAVWVESRTDEERATGIFYRPLGTEEADAVVERHMQEYRELPVDSLVGGINQEYVKTCLSAQGTPYEVSIKVTCEGTNPVVVLVQCDLDDGLGWWLSGTASGELEREVYVSDLPLAM